MRTAWRWRARQAALKAGQGAASGLVASVARGNEVRPRSAARQGTAGLFGRHGDDGGASPSAWRGVSVNGQGAARTACALKWGGASAARHREAAGQRGSEGAAAAQRGSERTRAQVPARAQSREGRVSGGEREGREKESGEMKEKVSSLTWFKLKIFN